MSAGMIALRIFTEGDDDPNPDPLGLRTEPPAEVLLRSNRVMTGFKGYRIAVSARNFVLPQWGGSDSGSVAVGTFPAVAEASLYRTGDGPYSMLYFDNATYFQRETCDHSARVPGGGRETMLPFMWGETKALQNAANPQFIDTGEDGPVVVEADVEYLGRVQVEIDLQTYLPVEMRRPASSSGDAWRFSDWGDAPVVEKTQGDVPDQGPGGNPC
jgi:hypothetical protein